MADAERALVAPFLPAPAAAGRPRRWPMRLLLDATLYVQRAGRAWCHLPREFLPWQTAPRWFLRLARAGAFERLARAPAGAHRRRDGRASRALGRGVDRRGIGALSLVAC